MTVKPAKPLPPVGMPLLGQREKRHARRAMANTELRAVPDFSDLILDDDAL